MVTYEADKYFLSAMTGQEKNSSSPTKDVNIAWSDVLSP